jgi:(p)ppGpp synthase/HD superfamily hydrolase
MPNGGDHLPQGHPIPPEPWCYTRRFIEAAEAALVMHANQVRKGTAIPYISHLFGACSIALDYGANEDEAIAALLHDAIEDMHYMPGARATVGAFGEEVLRIVDACTDADTQPKPPWKDRKVAYLAHLATADRAVLLVSGSDKLHNARAIVADVRRHGESLWTRFNVPKADTLWYYRSLVTAFRSNPAHPCDLIDELDRTVVEMERLGNAEPLAPASAR